MYRPFTTLNLNELVIGTSFLQEAPHKAGPIIQAAHLSAEFWGPRFLPFDRVCARVIRLE